MSTSYTLLFTKVFNESYSGLIRRQKELQKRIDKTLGLLKNDPFYPSLKTHKVQSRLYGERYSSRVTGDIRIIWDFDKDQTLSILLIDMGGHSGTTRVYN